jgi:hypothetical protein
MQQRSITLLVALVVTAGAFAAEPRPEVAVPKPRARLDPLTQTAIADPAGAPNQISATSVVTMAPVIVRAARLPSTEPAQPEQNEGRFSLRRGGRIAGKDFGSVRVEVGVWPYIDVIQHDGFKADKNHVGVDLLRVDW